MTDSIRSSETSVLTRATRRNIPVDDILHSRRRENLKSFGAHSYSLLSFMTGSEVTVGYRCIRTYSVLNEMSESRGKTRRCAQKFWQK
jgi:hypothetical protein